MTPQTITGQIKALEERLDGKLFKRRARVGAFGAGAAGVPLCRQDVYAQPEMLDIVNYRKESNLLFDVGVADALSKRPVSRVGNGGSGG